MELENFKMMAAHELIRVISTLEKGLLIPNAPREFKNAVENQLAVARKELVDRATPGKVVLK